MSAQLQEVQKLLKILKVDLRGAAVRFSDNYEPDSIDDLSLDIQSFQGCARVSESEVESENKDELYEYQFYYSAGIRLVTHDHNSDQEDTLPVEEEDDIELPIHVVTEIKATFTAKYLSSQQLTKEQIKVFSKNNVGYHVWPYWREFVQSSCSRLGMPPISIPMYSVKN